MLKNYNKYKLLRVFMDSPNESFRLRELSRAGGMAPLSVSNYLKEFQKEGLVKKIVKRNVPFYTAERNDEKFILYKKIGIIYEINESGLVDYLWENLSPDAIILYGSYAKGESTEDSDIDIFIIGHEEKIDLKKFEKIFGKEIHLIFQKDPKKIPDELKNNLINGIVLKGYFKAI
ncbi:MAG: nucleotidyltransferase domain-containing protein [Nanoarchaeota archaeon]|nr:nucleotidyltransferase domain-containing protein [Nanoarchaeota archaeon]